MSDDPNATPESESAFHRASSMMDLMPQTEEEMEAMRNAVVTREGLLLSVFTILRKVPRRVLMVFKLNDLTRYVHTSEKTQVNCLGLNEC